MAPLDDRQAAWTQGTGQILRWYLGPRSSSLGASVSDIMHTAKKTCKIMVFFTKKPAQ